jgi:hypothetical protein
MGIFPLIIEIAAGKTENRNNKSGKDRAGGKTPRGGGSPVPGTKDI